MIDFATATKRENLELLLADACHASIALAPELTLRAGGTAVSPAMRDEMLAKIRAGEHIVIRRPLFKASDETRARSAGREHESMQEEDG